MVFIVIIVVIINLIINIIINIIIITHCYIYNIHCIVLISSILAVPWVTNKQLYIPMIVILTALTRVMTICKALSSWLCLG